MLEFFFFSAGAGACFSAAVVAEDLAAKQSGPSRGDCTDKKRRKEREKRA